MRKLAIAAALLFLFASCKKRYDCVCFYSSNLSGQNYQTKESQIFDKLDPATSECEGMSEVIYQESPVDTITVNCQLIQ